MTQPNEPTTAAGRALLDHYTVAANEARLPVPEHLITAILAIEAEAAAWQRANDHHGPDSLLYRSAGFADGYRAGKEQAIADFLAAPETVAALAAALESDGYLNAIGDNLEHTLKGEPRDADIPARAVLAALRREHER